ncbi:hypothetical protein BC938DRAFT_478001 [Jimgerdemannia flammicorona]|uniref:Uncharacterized protein n=1 Tax=Jimgerdemannia flammicorona TaxID=994334 RepID=A0A433P6V5_9FUNG|nr:hypothetical protein BC938DRAFT_478001 [Jimgerdemannia flammicorona]
MTTEIYKVDAVLPRIAHKLESFRIRTSRNLDDKPRLSTPLNAMFEVGYHVVIHNHELAMISSSPQHAPDILPPVPFDPSGCVGPSETCHQGFACVFVASVIFHYFSHGDAQFFSNLHQALIDYALVSDSKPADVLAIFGLLRALIVKFGRDEVAGTVPLVFKIQALVREEKVSGVMRQRALATLTVQYFEMIADMFGVTLLGDYIEMVSLIFTSMERL